MRTFLLKYAFIGISFSILQSCVNPLGSSSSAEEKFLSGIYFSPSNSQLTVDHSQIASKGFVLVTLVTRDQNNYVYRKPDMNVVFSLANGTSTGTLGTVTDKGDGSYTVIFTGLKAGSALSVKATVDGVLVTSTSPTITVTPGALNSIVFNNLPVGSITADTKTSVSVKAYDLDLNLLTNDSSSPVNLAAFSTVDCTGAEISSSLSSSLVSLSAGVGTFTDLVIQKTSVKSIKATVGAKTVCSDELTVNAGALNTLVFGGIPASAITTDTKTTITVSEKDSNSNVLTADTSNVTLAAYDAASCGGSEVSGALSAASIAAVAGVGTFTDLVIQKTSVKSIKATVGAKTVCSDELTVKDPPRFIVVAGLKTWEQARLEAISKGGHLATIKSLAEENDMEADLALQNATDLKLWMGGSDSAVDGTWAWDNQESYYSVADPTVPNYEKWDVDSPDSSAGNLNDYMYWTGTGWGDLNSDSSIINGYVFEKDIHVFDVGQNFFASELGSRASTTQACEDSYNENPSWNRSCTKFVALLGYSADSGVQDLPLNYGLPTNQSIQNLDGQWVAGNWSSFIQSFDHTLSGTGISDTLFWSGFENGGAVSDNCSGWTSSDNSLSGSVVQTNMATGFWNNPSYACDSSFKHPYLCMCW